MNPSKFAISTTTDGKPPREGYETAGAPAPQRPDGQHESYWVLNEEERAKGFVRPVRNSYRHVKRASCGKPMDGEESATSFCSMKPDHLGECVIFQTAAMRDRGCGAVTTMGRALSETYAAQPDYYGSTFCAVCREHYPVGPEGEFVWTDDGQKVGT